MSKYHYYAEQLKALNISPVTKTIKIHSDFIATNYMSLNSESIPVVIKFLQTKLKRLKKESKNETTT